MTEINEHPLHRQIKKRLKLLGKSGRGTSLSAGMNETTIRKILENPNPNPRVETLEKIASVLGCTVDDLLERSETSRMEMYGPPDTDGDHVRHVDIGASAGGGIEFVEDDFNKGEVWSFPQGFIRHELRTQARHLVMMTAEGHSMMPTINPGDPIMIDISRRTPSPDGIFVLWDGIGRVVKRLEVIGDREEPTVRVISDNPAHSTVERTAEEITIIGRVVGRWERL